MDCDNIDDDTTASSSSLKYKSGLLKGLTSKAVDEAISQIFHKHTDYLLKHEF